MFLCRCAEFKEAQAVFDSLLNSSVQPDITGWNVVINMYGILGNGKEAENVFNKLLQSKIQPDAITFTSVCIHICCSSMCYWGVAMIVIVRLCLCLCCGCLMFTRSNINFSAPYSLLSLKNA